MCTVDWQELSCRHGYESPEGLQDFGLQGLWDRVMGDQAELWDRLRAHRPTVAPYAVGFAWRVRYSMQLNARAAMHMLELRSSPQGHSSYRRIAQRMHCLIADQAGHHAIAELMRYVDHDEKDGLGRLDAERRSDVRRAEVAASTG